MLVFDIETDGLLDELTRIHCINIYDDTTKHHYRYDQVSLPIEAGVAALQSADCIAGHNAVSYDVPALKKIFPGFCPKGRVLDTYVLTRLLFPDIKDSDWGRVQKGTLPVKLVGKHTLESWGFRLGILKGDFAKSTDWKTWSPAMSDYCEQDVVVTLRLFDLCKSRKPSPESVELEHETNAIVARQIRHGVRLNIKKAEALYADWIGIREQLETKIKNLFPPVVEGGKVFIPKRDNATSGYIAGAAMTRIKCVPFSPSSNRHVYSILMRKYGWTPVDFVKKSTVPPYLWHLFDYDGTGPKPLEPKVDETSLKRMGLPEIDLLADFLTIQKRIAQLAEGKQAWLKCVSYQTSRIHGGVITNGAVTGRMTHLYPNLAQVPAVYSPYGPECRELFEASPSYVYVGCDAAGLEARCQGHFLAKFDEAAFIRVILEGKKEDGTDIHSANRDRWKLTGKHSRDTAKTMFYAFIYGAGDVKLGSIAIEDPTYKGTKALKKLGKKLREIIVSELPGLKELQKAIRTAVLERGYLFGLDGRVLSVRSEHSALNLLFQSAGALLMKKALVILDGDLQAAGLKHSEQSMTFDYEFCLNIHDEWQIEAKPEHADMIGRMACAAIRKAGEHFKFRCQLDGEYKIGRNWKETH
jgi:DNA polymerase-1